MTTVRPGDATAIANLKARYCFAADMAAGDPDRARNLFQGIFTDDFVGDYGFPLEGPEAIIEFMCTMIAKSSEWMIHMVHSPRITVDGDTATGDWTVMVHMKRCEGGAVDVIVGRYADEFRMTPNGWRIVRVVFSRLV